MNDYRSKPDETVLLTVEARPANDGMYVIKGAALPTFLHPTSPAIVRVEPLPKPALPTAFGSRIVADIGGRIDVELVLASPTSKQMRWFALDGEWINEDELSNARVLHDPDATKSAVEADAPEPVELPTGLGAVVRIKTLSRDLAIAVRTADRLEPWRVRDVDGSSYWVALDDMADVTVLSPGIEVELP